MQEKFLAFANANSRIKKSVDVNPQLFIYNFLSSIGLKIIY